MMPGPVVVLEDQRTLVRAGGQDHLLRTDVPDPLAGDTGSRGAGRWSVRLWTAMT